MTIVVTVIVSLLGSAGVFSFVQFLITRRDLRNEKLDQISEQITDLNNEVSALSTKVDTNNEELHAEMLRNQAVVARVRILRASDEIRHRMKHSKEWFDQLNDDVTFYEGYCKQHPLFVNNKAMHAIDNINEVYAKALKENDFL